MATSKPPSSTRIGELVRLSVLSWSATLLTASYAGILPKMDPTFIASIFTGSLAWYGIERRDRDQDDASKRFLPKVVAPPKGQP
jgi:hypothetical protein